MGGLDYKRKLDKFQKALDVPKWYLGLSDYQERAIKELTDDLRDDFEQGTSFRVEKDLMRLGLDPIISKKKIRTMVQLSRGNDLAFIFFILEGYYITSRKNGEFSTNEKLMMTALSKIDLLPTLRELDRILPPPQLSDLDSKRQHRCLRQPKPKKSILNMSTKKSVKSKRLPYFQPQPRPKEIEVNYTSKPPNHIAQFPFWKLDTPPNYGTPTDPPWFTEYQLNPVSRLVKSTVGEAVDKYFDHLNHIKQLEARARVSKRALANFEQETAKNHEEPQLCAFHQFSGKEGQMIRDELIVKARDRCMELMDLTLPYRKLRQKRIIAQLEQDVDNSMQRYALKLERTNVLTISKADCVMCHHKMVALSVPKPQERAGRALVSDCLNMAHTELADSCVGRRLTGGGLRREPVDFDGELPSCIANTEITPLKPDFESCEAYRPKSQQRISFMLDDAKLKKLRANRKEQPVTVRYDGKQTKKSFFKAPTLHQPYQFKYKRIFKSGQEKPRDVKKFIAKTFVKSLKEDVNLDPICQKKVPNSSEDETLKNQVSGLRLTDSCSSTGDTSEHTARSHEDRKADIVDAVVRCAKEVWMKGVNIKRAEMERAEELASTKLKTTAIDHEGQKLDPDDSELMTRIIKDGLELMRQNQRYVLASLPDAHKLPVLQEWVKRRYGKQYTEAEVQKSIQDSIKVFDIISLLQGHPPPADLLGMDNLPASQENYAYCKQANALGKKVRSIYYQRLNTAYMDHTRACWYAMGNYLCPGGPPRKVFYAYMSANTRDIMRNKVWNGEFRDIRTMRENSKQPH